MCSRPRAGQPSWLRCEALATQAPSNGWCVCFGCIISWAGGAACALRAQIGGLNPTLDQLDERADAETCGAPSHIRAVLFAMGHVGDIEMRPRRISGKGL